MSTQECTWNESSDSWVHTPAGAAHSVGRCFPCPRMGAAFARVLRSQF